VSAVEFTVQTLAVVEFGAWWTGAAAAGAPAFSGAGRHTAVAACACAFEPIEPNPRSAARKTRAANKQVRSRIDIGFSPREDPSSIRRQPVGWNIVKPSDIANNAGHAPDKKR
jgi:hypothetical protein